jgi:hypothetical protein
MRARGVGLIVGELSVDLDRARRAGGMLARQRATAATRDRQLLGEAGRRRSPRVLDPLPTCDGDGAAEYVGCCVRDSITRVGRVLGRAHYEPACRDIRPERPSSKTFRTRSVQRRTIAHGECPQRCGSGKPTFTCLWTSRKPSRRHSPGTISRSPTARNRMATSQGNGPRRSQPLGPRRCRRVRASERRG